MQADRLGHPAAAAASCARLGRSVSRQKAVTGRRFGGGDGGCGIGIRRFAPMTGMADGSVGSRPVACQVWHAARNLSAAGLPTLSGRGAVVLWADRAACKDMPLVLFFGEDGERRKVREFREEVAKQVCADCPVKDDCLDFAIVHPEKNGIWGGANEDERSRMRRRKQRRKNHDLAEAS